MKNSEIERLNMHIHKLNNTFYTYLLPFEKQKNAKKKLNFLRISNDLKTISSRHNPKELVLSHFL